MGWRKVPGCDDWEVNEDLTPKGKMTFRPIEGRNGRTSFWKVRSRLDDFFQAELRDSDPRIETAGNGTVSVSIWRTSENFRLFLSPVDAVTYWEIVRDWKREAWQGTDEQNIMEKCLNDLYVYGYMMSETLTELRDYIQYLKLKSTSFAQHGRDKFDVWLADAHADFMRFGLNKLIPLTAKQIKGIQHALGVNPTGRWGLATARATKTVQIELKAANLYVGAVDGLWNSKMETSWKKHKESKGLHGIEIEDLTGSGYDPNRTILHSSLIEYLRKEAPNSLFVGHEELRKFLAQNESVGLIVMIGLTPRNDTLEPVFVLQGGKFTESVFSKIRNAERLAIEAREKTTTLKEIGLELEKNGVTPEKLVEMAEDLYKWYDRIDTVLFVYGMARKISMMATKKILKAAAKEGGEKVTSRRTRKKALDKARIEALKRKEWKKRLAKEGVKSGKGEAAKWVRHHLLPIEFQPYFKAAKIDIEEYVRKIGEEFHKVMHGKGWKIIDAWNGKWKTFFAPYNIEENRIPGKRKILNHLKKLCKEFGVKMR